MQRCCREKSIRPLTTRSLDKTFLGPCEPGYWLRSAPGASLPCRGGEASLNICWIFQVLIGSLCIGATQPSRESTSNAPRTCCVPVYVPLSTARPVPTFFRSSDGERSNSRNFPNVHPVSVSPTPVFLSFFGHESCLRLQADVYGVAIVSLTVRYVIRGFRI